MAALPLVLGLVLVGCGVAFRAKATPPRATSPGGLSSAVDVPDGSFVEFSATIDPSKGAETYDGDHLLVAEEQPNVVILCQHRSECASDLAAGRHVVTGRIYDSHVSTGLGGPTLPGLAIDQFEHEHHWSKARVVDWGASPHDFVTQSWIAFGFAAALVMLSGVLAVLAFVRGR